MGFIKVAVGSITSTLKDQWKDYYMPMSGVSDTAVIYPGVNSKDPNNNVISNGSIIVVPEGTAMFTVSNGKPSGFVSKVGAYQFSTSDEASKTIFDGDGVKSVFSETARRFKFGGEKATTHLVYYINLREIPNNRFGTQSPIYWFDSYLNAQVGARTRGMYTIKITDPMLFVTNFIPATYFSSKKIFDLQDNNNMMAEQMATEVISCLSPAFSLYVNDEDKGHSMMKIQSDSLGFAKALSKAVEDEYSWVEKRGISIVKTSIMAIEYDDTTQELLKDVNRADALSGNRAQSFANQAVARGIQGAGENSGPMGVGFMGMGINNLGMNNQQQENPTEKLLEYKKLLDADAITQEEYDKLKKQLLGL